MSSVQLQGVVHCWHMRGCRGHLFDMAAAGAELGRYWAGYEELGPWPAPVAYGSERLPEVRGREGVRDL